LIDIARKVNFCDDKIKKRGAIMSQLKSITCIVERGMAPEVVRAALIAGAEGATIFFGVGTGVRQKIGIKGESINPDKDIITIVTEEDKVDKIFNTMVEKGKLKEPAKGFAYIQSVDKAIGFLPH
jgi:nitrogen regulatory protein PII